MDFASRASAASVGGILSRTAWRTTSAIWLRYFPLEERLANLIADSIEPRLVPEIEIVPWRKTQVVVATVHASGSRPRNRVLARVFNELGLIEQWGTGVRRMIDACTRAGLSEPEFAEVGLRFRVTLRTEPIGPATVDATEKRILDYIADGSGRSTAAIAKHVGLSTRATQHRLAELAQGGLIAVVGSGPSDPRRRWHSTRKSAAP